MPMKTAKGIKNNKKPTLKKNVEKGTANDTYNKDMKHDDANGQRWKALKKKYEYKGEW